MRDVYDSILDMH